MRSITTSRSFLAPALLCIAASIGGCQTDPDGSDRIVAADPGFANQGFGKGLALYLPNRIFDIFDLVHVGVGLGPGASFELHLTRVGRIGAGAGVDEAVGWFGRMGAPFQNGHYARASFSVWDAQEVLDKDIRWRIPFWDVGVFGHVYLWEAYAGIAIDELPDLLLGFFAYDLKDDDYGRTSRRVTRDVQEGGVEEALPKEPGH